MGITTSEAKKHNMDIVSGFAEGMNTARYYPGGLPLCLKLLFEQQTLKLVGAQVISPEHGVKERIDALSLAMNCDLSAEDLAHIETAYTPPASSLVDVMTEAAWKVVQGQSSVQVKNKE